MRTSITKIEECHSFLINCLGIVMGKRIFVRFSKNIKYGNLKKNRVTYHYEEKGQRFDWFQW